MVFLTYLGKKCSVAFYHLCLAHFSPTVLSEQICDSLLYFSQSLYLTSSLSGRNIWDINKISFVIFFPTGRAKEKTGLRFNIQTVVWTPRRKEVLRKWKWTVIKTADISTWQRATGQEDESRWEYCRCEAWMRPSRMRARTHTQSRRSPVRTLTHPPSRSARQIPLMTKELSQHQLLGVLALSFSHSEELQPVRCHRSNPGLFTYNMDTVYSAKQTQP